MFNLVRLGFDFATTMALVLGYLFALVIGFTLHEAAHAFVAYKQGDPTPKFFGRLSLNPAKHIDPLGLVMLLLVGFGYAKPVPVNPQNFRHGRLSNFLVSFAGIFTNIVLALVFSCLYVVFAFFAPSAIFGSGFFSFLLYAFLQFGIVINLSLAVFNLIPIPPLDGFRILESVLGPKARGFLDFMYKYSFVFMLALLVVVMFVFDFIGEVVYFIERGFLWVFESLFGLLV